MEKSQNNNISQAIMQTFVELKRSEVSSDVLFSHVREILNSHGLHRHTIYNAVTSLGLEQVLVNGFPAWRASAEQIKSFASIHNQSLPDGSVTSGGQEPDGLPRPEGTSSQEGIPGVAENQTKISPEGVVSNHEDNFIQDEPGPSELGTLAETFDVLNKQVEQVEKERIRRMEEQYRQLEETERRIKERQKRETAEKAALLKQIANLTKQLGGNFDIQEETNETAQDITMYKTTSAPAQDVAVNYAAEFEKKDNHEITPEAEMEPPDIRIEELKKMGQELDDVKNTLVEREEEIEYIKENVKKSASALDELRETLKATQDVISGFRGKEEDSPDALRQLIMNEIEMDLQDKDVQIQELAHKLAEFINLENQINIKMENLLNFKDKEIQRLSGQVEDLQTLISELNGKISMLSTAPAAPSFASEEAPASVPDMMLNDVADNQKPKGKKFSPLAAKIIVFAVFLIVVVGAFFYIDPFALLSSDTYLPPVLQEENIPKPPTELTPEISIPQSESSSAAFMAPSAGGATPPVIPGLSLSSSPKSAESYLMASTTKLRDLTEKSAELEKLKVEVEIAELEAKLSKLKESAFPLELPQLAPVPLGIAPVPLPGNSDKPTTPPKRNRLIAVQGIDGKLVGLVDTGEGLKTIKVGDKFESGTVEKITSEGVSVRVEGRKKVLFFGVED
jgi:hypothetical protein